MPGGRHPKVDEPPNFGLRGRGQTGLVDEERLFLIDAGGSGVSHRSTKGEESRFQGSDMSDAISGDEDRKIREYMRMRGSGRRNSVSAEAVQAKEGAVRYPKPAGTKLEAKSAGDIAELRKAVAGNILFTDLEEEQMNMIVESCECKQYRDGDTVIRQGEAAHLFYIVKSGSLSVAIRDHDKLVHERRVLTYGPGDCFGELAVHKITRHATPNKDAPHHTTSHHATQYHAKLSCPAHGV